MNSGTPPPPVPGGGLTSIQAVGELLGLEPESDAYLYSDSSVSDSFSDSQSDDGVSSDSPPLFRPWAVPHPVRGPEDDGILLDTSFDFLEDANLSMLPQPPQPELSTVTDQAHSGTTHVISTLHPGSYLGARKAVPAHFQPVKQEFTLRQSASGAPRPVSVQQPPQPLDAVTARQAEEPEEPSRCPHCGRREDGERDGPGDQPAPGQYKARKRPRKENPLAFWNNKYGYAGLAYCKACSESFRSHLLRQGHQTRSGCSREVPCPPCSKILAGFDRPKETVFQQYDADRAIRMQKRQAATTSKSPVTTAVGSTVPVSAGDTSPSRKRQAAIVGAFALMSFVGVHLVKQRAMDQFSEPEVDGEVGNNSVTWNNSAWEGAPVSADASSASLNISSDPTTLQDSPLWTDPFVVIPARVHHKIAFSMLVSVVLACCGLRAKRRFDSKSRAGHSLRQPPQKADLATAGTPQAEVQLMCCGSRGRAVTWARWLVAFSVLGCVYSLCLSLVIVFSWDITWDAPVQHKTAAVFTTAETLTLFAAMPMFLIRFENLPYRKCFWHAWSFFAFIWVFSTVLRSLNVQSVAVSCVEHSTTVNAADATLAAQGSSCDLVIAAGLADCDSALSSVGELAHSCDVACGFRECSDSQADTRTRNEKIRGELLALLGWVQLAHPLLHVALGIVIWQAVVQVKEAEEKKAEEDKRVDRESAETEVSPTTTDRRSLSLGLLDKAVTPWLSLRLSNDNLVQPELSVTELGKANLNGDGHRLDDSVYTPCPMDTSIELPLNME